MRVRLPVAFVSKGKTGAVKEEVKHNHAEGASMVQDVIVYSPAEIDAALAGENNQAEAASL
jgi:hypothetical protein